MRTGRGVSAFWSFGGRIKTRYLLEKPVRRIVWEKGRTYL